ncbi:hypothetical protein GCM10009795_028690 [Nocardioides hankookensis]|uniref:TadE/TadG family type IV pilus assembly protein n=1 Tax=Nocardioides hankookensis TaxID=443157 RepID=A0ABW1LDV2_9ACTN
MKRRRDERGSITAIETLGMIPIIAIVVGVMFQLYLLAQAGVEAESAARLATREMSKGTPASLAESQGRAQANPRFQVQVRADDDSADEPGTSGAGDSVSATAEATVPFLGIGVPGLDLTIERSAVMPQDPGSGGFGF